MAIGAAEIIVLAHELLTRCAQEAVGVARLHGSCSEFALNEFALSVPFN